MIRKARKEDLPLCKKLMYLVVGEVNSEYYPAEIIKAWQEHVIKHEIHEDNVLVYDISEIVGFGVVEGSHIRRVYVHPTFQMKGIGKALMNGLEDIAGERGFATCSLNSSSNALEFYKNLGYEAQGPITIEKNGLSVTFTRMIKHIHKR